MRAQRNTLILELPQEMSEGPNELDGGRPVLVLHHWKELVSERSSTKDCSLTPLLNIRGCRAHVVEEQRSLSITILAEVMLSRRITTTTQTTAGMAARGVVDSCHDEGDRRRVGRLIEEVPRVDQKEREGVMEKT